MKNILSILLLLQVLYYVNAKAGFNRKVEITNFESTFNENGPVKLYSSIRKYNRTHTSIDANCTVDDVIDKRYKLKLEVQIWGDGGWKRNYISFENNDPCTHLRVLVGKTWKKVLHALNISEECPFQKGFYNVTDLCVDLTEIPLILTTGRFKSIVNIFKENFWVVATEVQIVVTDFFG